MSTVKKALGLAIMAAAMTAEDNFGPTVMRSNLHKVDPSKWKEEYLLIKQKKSNLTRSEREYVVSQVELLIKKRKLTEDLKPIY